jgi:hypothetical protein
MSDTTYNYSVFEVSEDPFAEFINVATHAPKVTMRAPSFPLEDLATGETIEMKNLWKDSIVVVEFGSFT